MRRTARNWLFALGACALSLAILPSALPGAPAPAETAQASGAIANASNRGGGGGTVLLDIVDAAEFSKQIERELASRGARIAIVFRAGRARSAMPEGIRYTHGAFWVYTTVETEDGRRVPGYAVYNLYSGFEDDPLRSFLHQDFPLDFTAAMAVGQAGVIVPTRDMQRRMLEVMNSRTYYNMHQPVYSLISNPFDARFQNCNEFMLDVVGAAAFDTDDRNEVISHLREGFEPTEIPTNLFQRMFARFTDSRLRTADHRGGIRTVTFASLGSYMEAQGFADNVFELDYVYIPPEERGEPVAGVTLNRNDGGADENAASAEETDGEGDAGTDN